MMAIAFEETLSKTATCRELLAGGHVQIKEFLRELKELWSIKEQDPWL